MSEDQDDSQKTEEPTQKKLDDASKRGQVVNSREITHLFMLFAFTLTLAMVGPQVAKMSYHLLENFITKPHSFATDDGNLRHMFLALTLKSVMILSMIIGALMLAAILSVVVQRPINISWEAVQPKLEKLSLMKGMGRIFAQRNIVEFLKGFIKICVVGLVAYMALKPHLLRFHQLPGYEMVDLLRYTVEGSVKMLIAVCATMAVVAALDYLYQRFAHIKQLRMSRHELKEEFKQQEGDPHIKAKVKAIRTERARKRMMAAVPNADVIITNPTHFAVALQYDSATMRAPKVVAKGQDKVALKIREIGEKNNVPIVENPPLARTLHANMDIDEEVPTEYYQAVAEVISYVYKLRNKLK
jgi:flagellar biosynthetic protein FlhB